MLIYSRKLSKERCLVVVKQYSDKGYEWNKYKFINPYEVDDINKSDNSDLDNNVGIDNHVADNKIEIEDRLRDYDIALGLMA